MVVFDTCLSCALFPQSSSSFSLKLSITVCLHLILGLLIFLSIWRWPPHVLQFSVCLMCPNHCHLLDFIRHYFWVVISLLALSHPSSVFCLFHIFVLFCKTICIWRKVLSLARRTLFKFKNVSKILAAFVIFLDMNQLGRWFYCTLIEYEDWWYNLVSQRLKKNDCE